VANLEFHWGVMGNSKSAEVAKRAFELELASKHPLIAKPQVDTKANNNITSRIPGLSVVADLVYPSEMNLFEEISKRHSERLIDEVVIDEAQFSTPKQVEELAKVAWLLFIPIICYGLKHDFQSRMFPGSQRLFELANRIKMLEKIKLCSCGNKASFNVRKIGEKYIFDGDQVVIDDGKQEIVYESICSLCFLKAGGLDR
jgi:thymidine kinase